MSGKVEKSEIQKSLTKLRDFARSQLFHTESDSLPSTPWAGAKPEDEDSMESLIDPNGTDYNGVKKALANKVATGKALSKAEAILLSGGNPLKEIAGKVEKGQKLTPVEEWCAKGGYQVSKAAVRPSEAGLPGEGVGADKATETNLGSEKNEDDTQPEVKKADEDEDDDEEKMDKSLSSVVEKSQAIQQGIEMSPFLAEFVHAFDLALRGSEKNIQKSLAKALAPVLAKVDTLEKTNSKFQSDTETFQKAIAEAVVGMGTQIAQTSELATQSLSAPTRGPKSQLRALQGGQGAEPIQKSFGEGPELKKSEVLGAMVDLVKSGKLGANAVIKYEHLNQMDPQVQQLVRSALSGNR